MEYVVNMNLMYIFTGIGRKHYPNTIREESFWNFIWNIGRLKAKALILFPPPPPYFASNVERSEVCRAEAI
jgi:hypothetical protein